jgi:pilus assembly protein CpaE
MQRAGAVTYRHQGRVIAVLAANPGSGVTTLASSLAFAVAAHHPKEVALAEVGNGVPELALDLDLKPRHTVDQLVGDWERVDASMVREAVVAHPDGVHVLAHAPQTLEPAAVTPPAMRQVVLLLRTLFEFSVLDLGHSLTPASLEAVRLADQVVIVVRLDVPSLRLGRALLRRLADQGVPDDKLRTVANRYGQRRQVAWQKAEEALGVTVAAWVPDDPGTVNKALNMGQPLVAAAPRASITRRIDRLAAQMNGRADS